MKLLREKSLLICITVIICMAASCEGWDVYKKYRREKYWSMSSNNYMFQMFLSIARSHATYEDLYEYYKNEPVVFLADSPFAPPDIFIFGKGKEIRAKMQERVLLTKKEFAYICAFEYKFYPGIGMFELWDKYNPKLRAFMKKANEETLKNLKKNQETLDDGPYIIEYSYMP